MNIIKILFSLVLLLIFSCSNKKEDLIKIEEQKISKEEFGKKIEILITKKGKANIKIVAPKVVRSFSGKAYNEFPEGMHLYVYNKNGKIESTLFAKYGKMGDRSSELLAKDSVVVTNKNGDVLNTEELIWDKNKSKIKTNGFVKIKTKDEIIYGDGFESNEDFTEYQITNIHGIVNIKKEEI